MLPALIRANPSATLDDLLELGKDGLPGTRGPGAVPLFNAAAIRDEHAALRKAHPKWNSRIACENLAKGLGTDARTIRTYLALAAPDLKMNPRRRRTTRKKRRVSS
jgi:hypothetical protein